jgi:hypothetical protein
MSVVRPWECASCRSRTVRPHCSGEGCPWIVCKACGLLTILFLGTPQVRSA